MVCAKVYSSKDPYRKDDRAWKIYIEEDLAKLRNE